MCTTLFAIRNPLSVAKSLARRDGFDYEKSYLLWLEYVITALQNIRNERRVFIDFDQLVAHPDRELQRMSKIFGLEINQ